MSKRPAFTLIEVLISIVLLGIILPPLYQSIILLRDSNSQLFSHLKEGKKEKNIVNTLYLDLASSDGNISIKHDEFTNLCIENTLNSLYGLSSAKVCWVVLKKDNTLLRVEGNAYNLPLKEDERVEVDTIMSKIELFDVYYEKDKILVLLQGKSKEPISFMVQGVEKPKVKKKKKKTIKPKPPLQ